MKRFLWLLLNVLRKCVFKPTNEVVFIEPGSGDIDKKNEIIRRMKYFLGSERIVFSKEIGFLDYLNFKTLVFLDGNQKSKVLKIKKDEVFNLDFDSNYLDGWDYHYLLTKMNPEVSSKGIREGHAILTKLSAEIKLQYNKAYVFGTGPSLDDALSQNFTDGVRIVSNTIVKDASTWNHISPNFIVAGDAIYHFGIGKFAEKFRNDLKLRLAETDTYFVFPSQFYVFCLKEFSAFKNRLIPIPIGRNKSVHHDLTSDYSLPIHGNALLLLLLPLACTLARKVGLWGFDGRSPDAKLFWKNSSKHFYSDDVEELRGLHPKFFTQLVPKESPELYAKKVHGDVLENALIKAENDGFRFIMMHHSYTETLQRRYADH